MDKNKMIICVLVAIVIVLLVALAAIIPQANKQKTILTFENGHEFNEGDSIQIKLTDANGTALANKTINITVTDKNRTSDHHSVVTNDEGIGTLKLDKSAGEYNVTISFGGNDKYLSCSSTQQFSVKKAVTESVSSTNNGDYLEGPEVDDLGITKEQVMRAKQVTGRDVKYDAKNGIYVQYDPNTGTYHT
ncbi:MAG: Ig-like domain-containing protein [Methanobrevibacter sp.]|nr:Ig-like domain-containing protein [Methanobrevibacter sp.]